MKFLDKGRKCILIIRVLLYILFFKKISSDKYIAIVYTNTYVTVKFFSLLGLNVLYELLGNTGSDTTS